VLIFVTSVTQRTCGTYLINVMASLT